MGKLVVLIPAHEEEESIGATIAAVLDQTRPADQVVVIANGCTDGTADVARTYPVTVLEYDLWAAQYKSEGEASYV